MGDLPAALGVGILVPCRNEERVIERKLRNLFELEWPGTDGALRVVVVDDHSTDETVHRAEAFLSQTLPANVSFELIRNQVRPGKNGAIECGLAHLGEDLDLLVLTDADVLVDRHALVELCRAFREDPQLGMACATQVFVDRLPESGDAAIAAEGRRADDGWDRMTRLVRRLESRLGLLFSVHGQWLAWRADLRLRPALGVAADDVDLMIQARSSQRPRVRMCTGIRFYECKPPAGEALDVQALRRARAWFQVFESPGRMRSWRGLGALQGRLYQHLPGAAPLLAVLACLVLLLTAFLFWGPWACLCALASLSALLLSPAGKAWTRTLRLIHQARRLERAGAMGEAWEMSRE